MNRIAQALKTGQSKSFGMGILTLLFVLLLFFGAIMPTIKDIIRIQKQMQQYNSIAAKLDEKIQKIYATIEQLRQRRVALQRFDVYYPYNLDYSLFVANLQYITNAQNAKLVSVSYSEQIGATYARQFKEAGITAINPVVFTITIEANYEQLLRFLQELESIPYLPQVLRLDYQSREKNDKQTFTVTVLLYRLNTKLYKDKLFDIENAL